MSDRNNVWKSTTMIIPPTSRNSQSLSEIMEICQSAVAVLGFAAREIEDDAVAEKLLKHVIDIETKLDAIRIGDNPPLGAQKTLFLMMRDHVKGLCHDPYFAEEYGRLMPVLSTTILSAVAEGSENAIKLPHR